MNIDSEKEYIEKIIEKLKGRKYNRERQQTKEQDYENAISYWVRKQLPILLVGFWGIGTKEKANKIDEASCKFLSELNNEIKEVYQPGIKFMFIFATQHARHNGIKEETMQIYIQGIKKLFKKYDFDYIYLEELWNKYKISFDSIDNIWKQKPKGWWEETIGREIIEKNAQIRNKVLSAKIAAQKYYIMRDLEKEMLEKEFPNAIFHAFCNRNLSNVLPKMPTLYFYSTRGWSNAPWFVE